MLTRENATDIVQQISERIEALLKEKEFIIIAIDGRCSAGKTTLTGLLEQKYSCNVIHADSFFLRPKQRTGERYSEPGGNIDYERLTKEVLEPLKAHEQFSYRPFSCKTQNFAEPVTVYPLDITVVEGAYSCHPNLSEYYDLRVFLNIDAETQKIRVRERNPQNTEMFFEKWIPLEEKYLEAFGIREKCELDL